MNIFYRTHGVPTDFVYTGKLVHALYQMLKRGAFSKGEKVLLIHSGGLQGNRSLTKGELIF
jgi:1-aminocyclopropane-1-carboxylate deaminase/D-cysteine desulfhydrase-like pyridoxal-dependent ACC family enzyme